MRPTSAHATEHPYVSTCDAGWLCDALSRAIFKPVPEDERRVIEQLKKRGLTERQAKSKPRDWMRKCVVLLCRLHLSPGLACLLACLPPTV